MEGVLKIQHESINTTWTRQLRSLLLVPIFKSLVALFLIISLLVFLEAVYMDLVVHYVKLFRRKPEKSTNGSRCTRTLSSDMKPTPWSLSKF